LEVSGGALHKLEFREYRERELSVGVEARVLVFSSYLSGCGTTSVVHTRDTF
jgi:hypothetical protein